MILDRETSLPFEYAFFALSLACLAAVVLSISFALRSRLPSRARWRRAALASAAAIAVWVPAFLWVRIHTGVGVLALGGGDHWISRAAEAGDAEAKVYLRAVVGSSNYGVNAAEAAVKKRAAAEQERLFTLLVEVVPWQNWKETYARRAAEARPTGGKH